MLNKKIIFFSVLFICYCFNFYSEEITFFSSDKLKKTFNYTLLLLNEDNINFKEFIYPNNNGLEFDLLSFYKLNNELKEYEKKNKENPFRRAEILFFGSLTFVTFSGWLFYSIYNVMIYNETFGRIRKEQFLPLYLGSCVISFAVVISDLFIYYKPKTKKVSFY